MMKRHNNDELGLTASEEEEYLIEFKSNDTGGPPQELSKMHRIIHFLNDVSR